MGKKDKYKNKADSAASGVNQPQNPNSQPQQGQGVPQNPQQGGNQQQRRPNTEPQHGQQPQAWGGNQVQPTQGAHQPQQGWGQQSQQPPQPTTSQQQPRQTPQARPDSQDSKPSQQSVPVRPSSSSSVSSVTSQMQKTKLGSSKALVNIESSPNGKVYEGTRGKPCKLLANYLKISVDKLIKTAFHYDVTFNPDVPKKMLPKALEKFMATHFQNVFYAFDGRKSFYTNRILAVNGVTLDGEYEQEVEAVLGDRSKNFKVKVQYATDVELSVLLDYTKPIYQNNPKPSQAIQCLDVILRTVFKELTANNRAVAVSRALYFPPDPRHNKSLGEGMELWLGLFQSAVLGRESLYLNVDVAHKAFPEAISLMDVLASFDRDGRVPPSLDRITETKLNEYLKMLSIGYKGATGNDPTKTFGYNSLKEPSNRQTFVDQSGAKMTVEQYFRTKNVTLRFPGLPCIHVGSKIRNVYLPVELCHIPAGQATNKKVTPNCVAQMIKYSATSTDDRKKKIYDLLSRINYDVPNGEVKGFGINVDKNFQGVDGRVLDPPTIRYKDGNVVPSKGVWNGKKFLTTQPQPIKWAIINCDDRTTVQTVTTLCRDIERAARTQGMNLEPYNTDSYFPINMMRPRSGELQKLFELLLKQACKLVFVIIIDRNDCYAQVKQAAELKVGILTQCIKSNTVFRMGKGNPMMTIGNILLKVNAKLNGGNHEVMEQSYQTLNKPNDGIMFVGGDVTHPSPDQRDIPSVVGVAASYDQHGFRYQCAWRLQQPTQEMIEDLENILTDQLQFYKSKNGTLPKKIMYYRDGVSDGQFSAVLDIEMTAIRGAMKRVYGTSPPAKVTFVVVQKRHHTRFFPTQPQFSEGKNKNIWPGTVVDKKIVHPFQYQFFMASHAAIQGVTKPTKYCILVNESKITPDDLQAITYDLCHLFTRCNRSVSYPAPTYYAHLVAARGKNYTVGPRLRMDNLPAEFRSRTINATFQQTCPMFFV